LQNASGTPWILRFHRQAFLGEDVTMSLESDRAKDFIYYYADWIWPSKASDWMKTLLLFFDGVALALPSDIATRVVEEDPVLAQPLMDRGLLINLAPESYLDQPSAELLVHTLLELLDYGDFDYARDFERLTAFHWGGAVAPQAADAFTAELLRRGLIEVSTATHLVSIHSGVKLLVLTVFAKALEASIQKSTRITLQPVTDDPLYAVALLSALSRYPPGQDRRKYHVGGTVWWPTNRYRSTVVDLDLRTVGVDLSLVPLDDVLAFREEHGQDYRAYARSLRQFLLDLLDMSPSDYQTALREREEQIADEAADLDRRSRQAFGRKATATVLSLAGAAWTAIHGDPIGALLAAATAAAGLHGNEPAVTAYSYLFRIRACPQACTVVHER
jgi:hypothetical protein